MENQARENRISRPSLASLLLVAAVSLVGCGGTKVLKEPEPITVTQALVTAENEQIAADLDWVIFRDGPGTWARNVDWDEYLITVRNLDGGNVHITGITVVDSLGNRVESRQTRGDLVKGTKETRKRYKGEGLKVKAGMGTGGLIAASAVTLAATASVGAAAMYAPTGAAVAATGGLVLVPVFAVGGVVRGVNNGKVNRQIKDRQTTFPTVFEQEENRTMHVFFPLVPSPQQVEIAYVDRNGSDQMLVIDTRNTLDGLHLADGD